MLSEKGKAVTSAEATASKNIQQKESYQSCAQQSSGKLKLQIGKLLLYLQSPLLTETERQQGWQLFDSSLRKLLAVRDLRAAGVEDQVD